MATTTRQLKHAKKEKESSQNTKIICSFNQICGICKFIVDPQKVANVIEDTQKDQ